MEKLERIKELVGILNEAGRHYYAGTDEIMSNYDYDKLYDELQALEEETGCVLSDSPTNHVGYETLSELPKDEHERPMLSLDKTKSVEELAAFAGQHRSILSWKLDGLTIVLTYNEGKLQKAVTRGNGYIGEVVTPNAKVFKNVPLSIPYKGELVVRGEALITYPDFERINAEITEESEKYKNPRNLCSGSVRQLNNEITARRNVNFIVYALIKCNDVDFQNSREKQFEWLQSMGFVVVGRKIVTEDNMHEAVQDFSEKVKTNVFPSDGLVLLYDDIAYGESLGMTAKFPRNSIAFKWADETMETTLKEIEWSASRTGLINPVAIFDPVELEGTTVSRASVHNVSIVKGLKLGIGDRITVYKANMIIPQIAQNLTESDDLVIPDTCPVCGGRTEIKQSNDVQSLYCTNPSCQAKHVGKFEHFVARDAMNIDGISGATLEKFIDYGFIKNFTDMYHLDRYRDDIVTMEGFGEKSYDNIIASVEHSKNTTLPRMIFSLGITGIGLANAKIICRYFDNDLDKLMSASREELAMVDKIGDVLADAFVSYFENEENRALVNDLAKELTFQKETINTESPVAGKVFVITGSVEHFANRNELKDYIEGLGGKTTGSVTSKTDYLINNDVNSASSKNKKAKDLNIPIISEEEFMAMAGMED